MWKELAKEVLTSKALLEGFLEPASSLALIRDHRTQELVFEALYRLWKVTDARARRGTWEGSKEEPAFNPFQQFGVVQKFGSFPRRG